MDDGTEFTMTPEDLPAGTKTAKDMIQGGSMITKTLKSIIETGAPSFGTRMIYVLFKLLEPMSPKATLTERWPL